MADLKPVEAWTKVARGVWRAELGDMGRESHYTDLAAEPPMAEALATLPEQAFPFRPGEITHRIAPDGKIMVRIPAAQDEKLYGLGLQLDGLSISKKVLTLNVDHWARGGGRTHAPVPFYLSSRGYGIFFNTARYLKVYAQVGNRKDSPNNPVPVDRNPPAGEEAPPWSAQPLGDAVEACAVAGGLDVVVFAGDSMLDVVSRYNLFCGGGAMPPLWGLGFWHRLHAHTDAAGAEQEVAEFQERGFPLDVIGLEPGWMSKSYPCTFEWQKKRFPDPAAFSKGLLDRGIRINLWENPYISPESRIYDAMVPYAGSHLVWLGLVPDYNLPEARRLLIGQHAEDHFKIGISGYKVDEVDGYDQWLWSDHATFPSGKPGEAMRQTYGLLMQHLMYHDLFKARDTRTYGNVRGSNGAASGYPFVIYSDSYDHAQYITGISAGSLCGILWTPEVRTAKNDREWLNRMQTTCFSPMANLDAWASRQKPWSYPSVADAVLDVIRLRMRLLPYLYSAFAEYHFRGVPPIRAMILEDGCGGVARTEVKGTLDGERDPYATGKVIETHDQFMFGPSLLVAPFYEKQATKRQVALPAGNWYDFYSGKFAGSNTNITVTAEALKDRIPLFAKDGAVIPMLADAVQNAEAAYGKPLEVRVYGTRDGAFRLYEDDGKTFDFQRGSYRHRTLGVKDGKMIETLEKTDGPAMFGPASLKIMAH